MDWALPTVTTDFDDVLTDLKSRDVSLAKMFDGVSDTNVPTGAKRYNKSNHRFEEWDGSSWVNMDSVLTDYARKSNNLSDLASVSTARTNLGLGALATLGSVNNSNWSGTALAVANGGTGATDAATARTNLGLGSLATSNATLGALATKSTVNNGDWSGTALAVANGGTGATSAASALTNLGAVASSTYNAHVAAVNPHGLSRATIGAAASGSNSDITTLGACSTIFPSSVNLVLRASPSYAVELRAGGNIELKPNDTHCWSFDSNGHLVPQGSNRDIGISVGPVRTIYCDTIVPTNRQTISFFGYTTRRSLNPVAATAQQCADAINTIWQDLVALGLYQ